MPASPPAYRLAIFDFDGTLADSFPFFLRSFEELGRRHGFGALDAERIRELRGAGARDVMREVGLPAHRLPRVARDFVALMRERRDEIGLFAGISEAVEHLAASGVALALVTSNARDNVEAVLGPRLASLFAQFECGLSIFGKAARIARVVVRAGVERSAAISIGDQATDLEASHRAGVAFGAL